MSYDVSLCVNVSKHENVKKLFKVAIADRTIELLQQHQYTNDELLEIISVANRYETLKSYRPFIVRLMRSQDGQFNSDVFTAFTTWLPTIKELMYLINHPVDGITTVDKSYWLSTIVKVANKDRAESTIRWVIKHVDKTVIDISSYPVNDTIASFLVNDIVEDYYARHNMQDILPLLFSSLDSMGETKISKWFTKNLVASISMASSPNRLLILADILSQYPNTPAEILTFLYGKITNLRSKGTLVMHQNCPTVLKMDMYHTHGTTKYLPAYLQTLLML